MQSVIDSLDFAEVEKKIHEAREARIRHYQGLIESTLDIPLQKMVWCCNTGCELFDELCLLIDINQRYVDNLPQWMDVAEKLQVDNLKTQWIQACIRPREGLTRAMLEIYMKDGGTLGEVLQALLDLECIEALEKLSPKIEIFLEERDKGFGSTTTDLENDPKAQSKFFSLLSTLAFALGPNDPCNILQRYMVGIKPQRLIVGNVEVNTTQKALESPCKEELFPKFRPDLHHKNDNKTFKIQDGSNDKLCRIMLLFSGTMRFLNYYLSKMAHL